MVIVWRLVARDPHTVLRQLSLSWLPSPAQATQLNTFVSHISLSLSLALLIILIGIWKYRGAVGHSIQILSILTDEQLISIETGAHLY